MAKKQEQPDNLQNLKQAIRAKDPGRLYFFYGEEVFLLHHYLQQLRKVIIDELTESFNYHKLTSETFDIREFADCVENLPMMAERTMVVVDEIDVFKMNESDREKMMDIFSDIPDYCTVVFTYETTAFKPDKRLKKLWDAVNKHGELIEFAKQNQRDLIAWITRHFAAAGKRIALFGSYDWGDGEWMRIWEGRCKTAGANLACDFVICHLDPGDEDKEACQKLGAALA